MRRAILVGALLWSSCAEPDQPFIRAQVPEIAVAPEEVSFGKRGAQLTWTDGFFITNGGRADLDVALTLEGDEDDVFAIDLAEVTLTRDASVEVGVTFRPPTFLQYDAEIVLTSNDEERPEIRIPVTGEGEPAPMPDIHLSTLAYDFGDIEVPSSAFLELSNEGTADLLIGALVQTGSPAFRLVTDPGGNTLAPFNNFPLVIEYTPAGTDGDSGLITIPSNDPDEDPLELVLLGNGGADYEYPVARIDCPAAVAPPTFVSLNGWESSDPEGNEPLTYEWSLVGKPEGAGGSLISDAYLTNETTASTDLWVDAVGDYAVQLVVENTIGIRSAPAICAIEAIPEEQILVELTWSTPNADMDIHLTHQNEANNAPIFEKPRDASWCNRTPNWGEPGRIDDPSLDLDDRAGFGPENMNVDEPGTGRYDVRVHYFAGQGDDISTATVRVYLNGELEFTASQNLAHNDLWEAARINWDANAVSGTVAPLSVDVGPAPVRRCY